ncbi:MAG: alpha/beta hydrolase [Pseudomonadales bacterium]
MELTRTVLSLWLLLILSSLVATPIPAKEAVATDQALGQAYLAHWFSIDSAEPINMEHTALEADDIGERGELKFTSDDGQPVNGQIAFPSDKVASGKLALILHPMGSDQRFWWSEKNPLGTQHITDRLREQGYTVISLDARLHGKRSREGFGPRELLTRAHSTEPRTYIETIIGSVRDYRIVLNWAANEFGANEVLAMGYSMGAQMSLLLASYEPRVNTVVAMVPPYVGSASSPVAPRKHVQRINTAKVLWLAGSKDPHSNAKQTQATFDEIVSPNKTLTWFEAGHRLPPEFLDTTLAFLSAVNSLDSLNGAPKL